MVPRSLVPYTCAADLRHPNVCSRVHLEMTEQMFELARHTFRNSLLLEYEIPKFEGDLGQPNFFVHVDARLCEQKIGYLTKFFPSQHDKHWFTEDTFWSLMRIRGIESKAPSGHAEAFHCRKLVAG